MNSVILILVIMILIIFYLSPFVIKKAFKKPAEKASIQKPSTDKLKDYYKPISIWSSTTGTCYVAYKGSSTNSAGVEVVKTGDCGLYTYGTVLVSENSEKNSDTSFNPLSQVVYTKPNIENGFQNYIDGKSHLSGKIKDHIVTCVDADQIYIQHVEKTCEVTNSQARCLSSKGFYYDKKEKFTYNKPCLQNPCNGIVGSLSLNYLTDGDVVLPSTLCMTITKITIPEIVLSEYNIQFFLELQNTNQQPIIVLDSGVPANGPYPIEFNFASCNPEDARQRLKFISYTYSPKIKKFVESKNGSYGAIIFRDLECYLDILENNSFILRQLTKNPEDSIKWIFMPEMQITRNTIPSKERCSLLTTLMNNGQGAAEVAAYSAEAKKTSMGINLSKIAVNGINKTIISKLTDKTIQVKASVNNNPAYTQQGPGIAETNLDEVATGATEATAVDATTAELSTEATASTTETIASVAGLQAATDTLASVLSFLGPIAAVIAAFSVLSEIIPNPSYSDPPFGSLTTTPNQLVSPSDYGSNVTATGPTGVGTLTNWNNYCLPWANSYYPQYYFEALTGGTQISTNFINYKYQLGSAVTFDEAVTFGADSSKGLQIWNSPGNIDNIIVNQIWEDGNTQWLVHDVFDNSLAFPPSYFSSKVNGAESVSPTIVKATSGYVPSNQGIITSTGLSFSPADLTQLKVPGRQASSYLNIPGTATGQGTSALFDVTVIDVHPSGSESVTEAQPPTVSFGGRNYKAGDTITISGTDIGGSSPKDDITFSVGKVASEVFIFKSLNKTSSSYYYPEETSEKVSSGGFETFGTINKDTSGNNQIVFEKNSNGDTIVGDSGFGFAVNDPIYLVQYNYLGQRVSSPVAGPSVQSAELSKFSTLSVNSITESGYEYGKISPENLVYENEQLIINYNFMDSASNLYSKSPQQIVYAGVSVTVGPSGETSTFARVFGEATGGNINPKTLYDYFLVEKTGQFINTSKDSPIINLKSIQIENIKYTSNPQSVNVSADSSVVLGRFIPYQFFAPSTRRIQNKSFNVVTNTYDTATDPADGLYYGASIFYYNGNYAQIIPYGVQNVYENGSFPQSAPKF